MPKRLEQYTDFIARLYPPEIPSDGSKILSQTVTFQVSEDCNLCCTYCYQTNKTKNSMKLETAKEFVDMLLTGDRNMNEYINPEISPAVVIEFIGGEPFLEIDLIDKITDYFVDRMIDLNHPWLNMFRISICSNGILYFDPRVQAYLKKHLHHLSFSISIDGNKELHDNCRVFADGSGSYDIAIAGVNHFVDVLGGNMGSKMTLCPQNIQHTFSALKNLIGVGYDEIFLNCVYEKGWEQKDATILYYQLTQIGDYILEHDLEETLYVSIFDENLAYSKSPDDLDNWCGGNGTMIAMDWKGDIYPCIRYMDSSLNGQQKPMVIGNINEGILKTKEQSACLTCLKNITRKSQSTEECFNCPIAQGCSWCTAYNYQEFGTPNKRAIYICETHKARALANVYFWNKKYLKNKENKIFQNNVLDEWALKIISEKELLKLKKLEKRS